MYSCTLDAVALDTTYTCTESWWTFTEDACTNGSDYKIVIDTTGSSDGFAFDSVFVELRDGEYWIEAWCVPDAVGLDSWSEVYATNVGDLCPSGFTAYDTESIQGDDDTYTGRIVLYFDTDVAEGISYNASWADATNFCIDPVTDGCDCTGLW